MSEKPSKFSEPKIGDKFIIGNHIYTVNRKDTWSQFRVTNGKGIYMWMTIQELQTLTKVPSFEEELETL